MSDESIIALYFKRDENAIKETDMAYGVKLNRLSFSIVKNNQDSEECVSDTYLKAWNNIPPTRPMYFFAYLAKICRFLSFDRLDYKKAKKRSADVVTLSDELMNTIPSNLTEMEVEEEELGRVLSDFVRTLSEDSQVLFVRRYFYMDKISDIASRYKVSESKVKTSLFRSRQKLKKYLEGEGIFI